MSPKVTEEYKDSKRIEILEAAKRVFIRKGYQAVTMKDVVEESGLSRGGVYLYYGSTEELMLDLLSQKEQDNDSGLTRPENSDEPVWKTIEMMSRHIIEEAKTAQGSMIPVMLEFFIINWRSGKWTSLMDDRYATSIGAFRSLIETGVDRGEFHPIVPIDGIVGMMISFSDGLLMDSIQFGHETVQADRQMETMLTSMRHLLQVKS
ncbi:TetR family transcriptional regulator [Gorillibacterium massiliense]|uniref:TetR family transcriptional regulator n=1 Tax=Gorillibacterium massiliense TaxID=1280390 RepID=UPI0004B3D302|nr:TetR family transcriptional regulator [Gorillibacterium massiliense]